MKKIKTTIRSLNEAPKRAITLNHHKQGTGVLYKTHHWLAKFSKDYDEKSTLFRMLPEDYHEQ